MIVTICHNFDIWLPDEQSAWQCIEQGQRLGCRAGRGSRGGSGRSAPPSKDQSEDFVKDSKSGSSDVAYGRCDVVLVRNDEQLHFEMFNFNLQILHRRGLLFPIHVCMVLLSVCANGSRMNHNLTWV